MMHKYSYRAECRSENNFYAEIFILDKCFVIRVVTFEG